MNVQYVLVSLTSTTPVATDLGYLLHKHPAERLDVFAEAVFGRISAASVVLTTPNREYNSNFEHLDARGLRRRTTPA